MAKSLIDDAGFEAIGQKKTAVKKSGKSGDGVKLALAFAAIICVAGILTWYYDLLGWRVAAAREKAKPTAERQKQFDQQEKDRKADEELNPDRIKGAS